MGTGVLKWLLVASVHDINRSPRMSIEAFMITATAGRRYKSTVPM